MRNQDVIDASQLDVDLEAEVGEGLWGRLHYVLHLHALGGHAQEGVSHPLHLSWGFRDWTFMLALGHIPHKIPHK